MQILTDLVARHAPLIFHVPVLLHAACGTLAMLAALWTLAELRSAGAASLRRARRAAWSAAAAIGLSFLLGGIVYREVYPLDKPWILAGPLPWAHGIVMETKEHLFFSLLILACYLPVSLRGLDEGSDPRERRPAVTAAVLVVLLVLLMEAGGALTNLGLKLGAFAR